MDKSTPVVADTPLPVETKKAPAKTTKRKSKKV
jgi:hypothetical protein